LWSAGGMRIDNEEPGLKEHLMGALQPLCEADPELLADYVIEILKNDSTHDELVSSVRDNLSDFLADNTEVRPSLARLARALCAAPATKPNRGVSRRASSIQPCSTHTLACFSACLIARCRNCAEKALFRRRPL
jgi:hypothetical protein